MINREIEETTLNLRIIQYEKRKNEISEKINRINKQRENSSKTSYINEKNIENNTQAPKASTALNSRNTAEVIQREKNCKQEVNQMKTRQGKVL